MSVSRQLYEDMIPDHNRTPRNFMRIPRDPGCNAHGFNPICGNYFHIYLQVKSNIIKDASFNGAGCAISTASASLMTEAVMTLTADEFIRRFLLHVLPSGFHRRRHYGLIANANRKDNLVRARKLLQVKVVELLMQEEVTDKQQSEEQKQEAT